MLPEAGKTAVAFHAKDDVAEVRHQVFRMLMRHDIRFYAVVRDKRALLASVRLRNEVSSEYRYRENDVYDGLVARLFRDRLHKAADHAITFARRGSSDRTRRCGRLCCERAGTSSVAGASPTMPRSRSRPRTWLPFRPCRRRTIFSGRCNASSSVARIASWRPYGPRSV